MKRFGWISVIAVFLALAAFAFGMLSRRGAPEPSALPPVEARAMDAQAWLVACDMAWTPPLGADPLGLGRSAVVDPLGGVRGRLGHAPELLVTSIDLGAVAGIRARVPIL